MPSHRKEDHDVWDLLQNNFSVAISCICALHAAQVSCMSLQQFPRQMLLLEGHAAWLADFSRACQYDEGAIIMDI